MMPASGRSNFIQVEPRLCYMDNKVLESAVVRA